MIPFILTPTKKKMLYSFVLVILTCGVIVFFIIYTPTPKEEIANTDQSIENLVNQVTDFQQEVEEHKVNTVYRTTVIRDTVQYEVSNLDPDALAAMALQEIEIYQKSLQESTQKTER